MDEHESTSDSDLVKLASQGCESSFKAIFDRYYHAIHRYAWQLCQDSSAAEDIAQQTFIKIASSLKNYLNEGKFKAWIYKIALNQARDYLKITKRYRQRITALEGQSPIHISPTDKHELLTTLLEQLPPPIRETVILVHAHGFTQKETAKILNRPEGTISWRIAEARKIIRSSASEQSSAL